MTPSGLRPFWRYYGAKWRAAPRYPAPTFNTIVEPFAGAAGYSLRYPDRNVILVEKYPVIAEIWRYLIGVKPASILRIPLVDSVDELPAWVPQPARWLVGFCMNAAPVTPRVTLSSGLRKFREQGRAAYGWSEQHRARVAAQVDHIRHWRVIEGDYSYAPFGLATWFIDPPYRGAPGAPYPCGSRDINYDELAGWVSERPGQVIACEAVGADWLPFVPHSTPRNRTLGRSVAEAVWIQEAA